MDISKNQWRSTEGMDGLLRGKVTIMFKIKKLGKPFNKDKTVGL